MRIIYLLSMLMLLASCKDDKVAKREFNFYPAFNDTSSIKKFLADETVSNANSFNLSSLLNGVDSFELRIWPLYAFGCGREVIVIKCQDKIWKGYRYYSYTLPVLRPDGAMLKYKDALKAGDSIFLCRQLTPAVGWQNFLDRLDFYGITYMATQDSIPGLERHHVLDGTGWTLETATKSSYRNLSYFTPDIYQDDNN